MNELEEISARLAAMGFHPVMHRRRNDWTCQLFNNVMKGVPLGVGPTALAALHEAAEQCVQMKKEGR